MKPQTVPTLNLAPKRRNPLALWNPLDYLQLLYWVFFFPQALTWYVEVFAQKKAGENKELSDCKSWAERRQWWRSSPVQRNFWVQGLVTTVLIPTVAAYVLNFLGIPVDMFGVAFGVALGVAGGVAGGVAEGVAGGVAFGVALGVAGGVAGGVAVGVAGGVAFGVAVGVAVGVAGGVAFGVAVGVAVGVAGGVALGVAGGVAGGVALGVAGGVAVGVAGGVALGVAGGVAFGGSLPRPEVWLSAALTRWIPSFRLRYFSNATYIPLPQLTKQITGWFQIDWLKATENTNNLLAYTGQFVPVVNAVNQSLAQTQNNMLLLRVSQLAANPFDWGVIKYSSASLTNNLKKIFIDNLFILPAFLKQRLKAPLNTQLRLDTPARAAAAGFWHLHKNHPSLAAEAFSQVQHLPHGEEMHQLSQCLAFALSTEKLNDANLAASLNIPNAPLLRDNTWPAISRLRSVTDDAQIIYNSYSRSAKSLALNRALGKLTEVVNKSEFIPLAERNLILTIAKGWRKKLLDIATDVGEATHTQPVHNPYVAGDPVEGDLFVGRGEVIKQLEELWLVGNQLQSVVLYGHRRMGKTSILKNLSTYLSNNIQVVYINLLNLGSVSQGAGEVLITLTDAISQQLSIQPPDDDTLLNLPYPTFRRFVQTINKTLKAEQGLIIALDEFEKIEELILANKLDADFLGYLRGLLQMSPKIAFAFAGLHTLEEMTADYFNPLFASVLPIRIGFFTLPETRELLANPAEDFTLDYRPETLNEIYRLTAGQPYLTQLIGFQLVRHYNHQVFEQGTKRTPIFTPQDLDTVIHHNDFFTKGRYYFTGVWNQAAQDAPGQQIVLKLLAEKEDGCTTNSIRRKSNLSQTDIIEALKTLTRHDVVTQNNENWKIIVPLFRQWVLKNQ